MDVNKSEYSYRNLMKSILLMTLSLYTFFLSGCWSSPPKPPLIPPVVNAKLPAYGYGSKLNWTDSNDYDASALFYIDYDIQYAEQNHWGYISDWYIYKLNKIETLEGQFDEDDIYFLCHISHAKPGAWIQFSPISIQYKKRMVLQLGLKKKDKYYAIVSQKQKSWIEPYGELVKPELAENFKEIIYAICKHQNIGQAQFEEGWELHLKNHARRLDLVSSFSDSHGKEKQLLRLRNNASLPSVGNFEIVDENDEFYVTRVNLRTEKEKNLMVNKTTLDVKPLPIP